MVRTPECALLLVGCTALAGSGVMLATNIAQMADALGRADRAAGLVTVFAAAQTGGRIFAGLASEAMMRPGHRAGVLAAGGEACLGPASAEIRRRRRSARVCRTPALPAPVPRPVFLCVACLLMGLALLVMGLGTVDALLVGTAVGGFAFGHVFPLMVVLALELFGPSNAGGNYLLYDGWCSAVGTLCLAKLLPQAVARAHSRDGGRSCSGPLCYRLAFWGAASLCFVGAACLAALVRRSAPLYARISAWLGAGGEDGGPGVRVRGTHGSPRGARGPDASP
jgi:hypothetical protein